MEYIIRVSFFPIVRVRVAVQAPSPRLADPSQIEDEDRLQHLSETIVLGIDNSLTPIPSCGLESEKQVGHLQYITIPEA